MNGGCGTGFTCANNVGAAPTCTVVSCPAAPAVTNAGSPVISGGAGGGSTTTYGATAAYTCNTGYTKTGSDATCSAAGTWSTPPTCTVATAWCPVAPTVTNAGAAVVSGGIAGGTTTSYQATAAYTCNVGYTKSGADSTCQASQLWSAAPTCAATAVYCPATTAPTNGSVTISGGIAGGMTTSLNATRAFACNAGYTLTGTASSTCNTGGTWSAAAPTCVSAVCGNKTDVIYTITGGFDIRGTTFGIGNQTFGGLVNNATTPTWGTNGGSGSASPFNRPPATGGTTFTRGHARVRFNNDAAGNPLMSGGANLVEFYLPLEFTQTAGATVNVNVDHSLGIIQNNLTNCGGGDAACVNHVPNLNRTCASNAAGTFSATTLNWGACTNWSGANSWNWASARAVTGAGCAIGWNAFGNSNSTSSLVPASGKGDSYQTWNQKLSPFVYTGSNPRTATFTMTWIQIPNGTGQSNTWMQVTGSAVSSTICGTTVGTDLVCNTQP